MKRVGRGIGAAAAALVLAAAALGWIGYRGARQDPLVREIRLQLSGWSATEPVRIALLGDVHIGNAAMDAARLTRIVDQVNARRPDIVLIAGDFVFGHDPQAALAYAAALEAPLAKLRAPLGVIAVPGNHDHWTAPPAIAKALRRAGITLLVNRAERRGPLKILGMDDPFTDHADVASVFRQSAGMGGVPVLLSHSPDVLPMLPRGTAPLVLTAHTHCGQVVLPLVGPLASHSLLTGRKLYDARYRCGMVRDPGRVTIVTGGLGTSGVPLRYGAPPDWWLITLLPRH